MQVYERDNLLNALKVALEGRDLESAHRALGELHPPELLEHWDEFNTAHRHTLLSLLPAEQAAEIIANLEASEQAELLESLPNTWVAEVLEALDPDDLADLLQSVRGTAPKLASVLLTALSPEAHTEVEQLLKYAEDDAGGLMTPEFVALRASMTVEEVLRFLRRVSPDAETVYYLYVVDEHKRLIGVISLRDLIVSGPQVRVKELMNPDVIYVTTETDQEEVARLIADYNLTALPVVDTAQRLVGIVTVDDVVDVLEEEATEDIYRLGAVEVPELVYSHSSVLALWSARVRWLVVLVLTGMITSSILAGFGSVLHAVTALSFYLPVLLGTGGNTGSQSATLIVRALATRDIALVDWVKIAFKEIRVGALLGLTLAALIALKVMFDGFLGITLVVVIALFFLVIVSNLAGALFPLLIKRIGLDPALMSNPLIATVSDVSGLLIYLSAARILLRLG